MLDWIMEITEGTGVYVQGAFNLIFSHLLNKKVAR